MRARPHTRIHTHTHTRTRKRSSARVHTVVIFTSMHRQVRLHVEGPLFSKQKYRRYNYF